MCQIKWLQANSVLTLQYNKVPTRNGSNDRVVLTDSVDDTIQQAIKYTKSQTCIVLFHFGSLKQNSTTMHEHWFQLTICLPMKLLFTTRRESGIWAWIDVEILYSMLFYELQIWIPSQCVCDVFQFYANRQLKHSCQTYSTWQKVTGRH